MVIRWSKLSCPAVVFFVGAPEDNDRWTLATALFHRLRNRWGVVDQPKASVGGHLVCPQNNLPDFATVKNPVLPSCRQKQKICLQDGANQAMEALHKFTPWQTKKTAIKKTYPASFMSTVSASIVIYVARLRRKISPAPMTRAIPTFTNNRRPRKKKNNAARRWRAVLSKPLAKTANNR